MKAIALYKFGSPDVLEFREVDKPVVSDDEVLVRVCAASVNPHDWHVMRGEPLIMRGAGRAMGMGLRKPTISVLGVVWRGGLKRSAGT